MINEERTHQFRITPRMLSFIGSTSLILGLLFDYLFYEKIPGISFPIYITLILAAISMLTALNGRTLSRSFVPLSCLLLFFSAMVFIRADGLLTFFNIATSLYLLAMIMQSASRPRMGDYTPADYLAPFLILPFKFLGTCLRSLAGLITVRGPREHAAWWANVARGIIITIPVIVLFVALFSSADLIFAKYIGSIFSLSIGPETIVRTILIICITLGFLGTLGYLFGSTERTRGPETRSPRIGTIETSILLGSLNILFFLFILLQIAYLFGSAQYVISQGFTYAEYARKGFGELTAVAFISLLLILALESQTSETSRRERLSFTLLASGLAVQVMVIMASAFKRLLLYEYAYGFTTMRLYSHLFTILLAVIFLLLLYKIIINSNERIFATSSFLSALILLGIINLGNTNAFIAAKNLERFSATGKLDASYLANLSIDAPYQVMRSFDALEGDLKSALGAALYWKRDELVRISQDKRWQSANIARSRALRILNEKASLLEKYKMDRFSFD